MIKRGINPCSIFHQRDVKISQRTPPRSIFHSVLPRFLNWLVVSPTISPRKKRKRKIPRWKKVISLSLSVQKEEKERIAGGLSFVLPRTSAAPRDPSWRRLCVVCLTTACPLYDIKFLPSPRDKIFLAESRVLPWDLIKRTNPSSRASHPFFPPPLLSPPFSFLHPSSRAQTDVRRRTRCRQI